MKKILNWQVVLGIVLLAASAAVYYLHFLVFHDVYHIFLYLIGDIAFVFIEVLMVTLIIHKLLNAREKKGLLKKLNMVIGVFYSEVGTELLTRLFQCDIQQNTLADRLLIKGNWEKKEYMRVQKYILNHAFTMDLHKGEPEKLKAFLMAKRDFLLRLLENQNLLEHETFTNLLWAVFHLTDELSRRKDCTHLDAKDGEHICIDMKRVYGMLITEWLSYMGHLQKDYPYLFSLALRTNPFDSRATIEVN